MQTQQLPCCCRSRQEDCFDRLVEVRDADCSLRLLWLVLRLVCTATVGMTIFLLQVRIHNSTLITQAVSKNLKDGVELSQLNKAKSLSTSHHVTSRVHLSCTSNNSKNNYNDNNQGYSNNMASSDITSVTKIPKGSATCTSKQRQIILQISAKVRSSGPIGQRSRRIRWKQQFSAFPKHSRLQWFQPSR